MQLVVVALAGAWVVEGPGTPVVLGSANGSATLVTGRGISNMFEGDPEDVVVDIRLDPDVGPDQGHLGRFLRAGFRFLVEEPFLPDVELTAVFSGGMDPGRTKDY